jgi:hypothetical protein
MLANVEFVYWSLYAAYWNLYARESGMRLAYESWRVFKAQLEAGRVAQADEAQARGQYHLFRSQRLDALQNVLESERQLRRMLGIPIEDGTRLIPSDQPTLAPFQPDWESSLHEAYTLRPELYLLRQQIKVDQFNLIAAKNAMLPDVRLTATYDFNSLGSRLDGSTSSGDNALANLAKGDFSDWAVGIRANIPLGYRAQAANVRIAKLRLARNYWALQDQEYKLQSEMDRQYGRLQYAYESIKAFRDQRLAYGEQLRSLVELVYHGSKTPDILLEAQRFYADALAGEYNAIRDYNNAIVAFEYTKGTIMEHDSVTISEGCLPSAAYKRAVVHEQERAHAIQIRTLPLPEESQAPACGLPAVPKVPTDGPAPSLTSLMKTTDNLPPTTDKMSGGTSIFSGHDAKPVDMSTLPASKNAQPVLPASTGSTPPAPFNPTGSTPAVKLPTDSGATSSTAPKPPAGLSATPVPIDLPATKNN